MVEMLILSWMYKMFEILTLLLDVIFFLHFRIKVGCNFFFCIKVGWEKCSKFLNIEVGCEKCSIF